MINTECRHISIITYCISTVHLLILCSIYIMWQYNVFSNNGSLIDKREFKLWQSFDDYNTVEFIKKLSNSFYFNKIFFFSLVPLSFVNPPTYIYVTNWCDECMYQLSHTNSKLIEYRPQYDGETHKKSEKRKMLKRSW